jgi:hypothetical protein
MASSARFHQAAPAIHPAIEIRPSAVEPDSEVPRRRSEDLRAERVRNAEDGAEDERDALLSVETHEHAARAAKAQLLSSRSP